jgi:hypothetical protein
MIENKRFEKMEDDILFKMIIFHKTYASDLCLATTVF